MVMGALVVLLGLIVWRLVAEVWPAPPTPAHVETLAVAARPSAKSNVETLIHAHLFGVVAAPSAPVAAPPDWQVLGIVAGTSPDESRVDIRLDGTEHLWKTGDTLPNGARITAINANSVTLQQDNKLMLVPFELRAAPLDAVFKTLPVVRSGNSGEIALAAPATPRPNTSAPPPMQKQLATLRAAALRIWAARTRAKPPMTKYRRVSASTGQSHSD